MNQTLKSKIVQEYLERFPSIPSMTIARKIYKENVSLFTTLENVRTMVRKFRGSSGDKLREKAKFIYQKKLVQETLALPKSRAKKHSPYILPQSQKNVLIMSDLHFPFQNNEAIEIAVNYGLKQNVDTVLLNGDIIDFHAISRWQSDPRSRDLKFELESTRKFLKWLRNKFPKALILYKLGNHDIRLEDYLINKAPELLDTNIWEVEKLFEFEKFNIIKVESLDYIKLGKLKVIHGHEYKQGFVAPVNPARGLFLRTKESCLQSHVHRTSEHTEKTIAGKIIVCYSIGCLSDLTPDYNRYNNYNLGFAIVEVERGGNFTVYNKKIIDNKLF
jgi:metallophosphoesterase superfamily enzyme